MKKTKDPSSINPAKTKTTLHSSKITQASKIQSMTAEEIFEQASATVQDSHWDAIVDYAKQMGKGQ